MTPSPKASPRSETKSSPPKSTTPSQVPAVKKTVPEDEDQISWDDGDELVDPSEAKETKAATPVASPKDAAHDSTAEPKAKTSQSTSQRREHADSQARYRDKIAENVKSDYSHQQESSDPDEIVKQVSSPVEFSSPDNRKLIRKRVASFVLLHIAYLLLHYL